jgi:hypothetical protein
MKNWKIIIQYEGEILEVHTQAKYYSDAYVYAEITYPDCVVVSISEIREKM